MRMIFQSRPSLISRILLLIITVCLLSMLLTSCSDRSQARRLVRQAYRKLEKAQKLDPSVIDSIKSVKDIDVFVPGDSGNVTIQPEIDTADHGRTVHSYDSALLAADSLQRVLKDKNTTHAQMERAISDLQKANTVLRKARERFKTGFLKDSTYHVDDSLISMDIEIKAGKFHADYKIKDRTVKTKVATTDIHLDGSKEKAFYRYPLFWILLLLIFVLLLVIIVIARK